MQFADIDCGHECPMGERDRVASGKHHGEAYPGGRGFVEQFAGDDPRVRVAVGGAFGVAFDDRREGFRGHCRAQAT